MNSKTMVIAGLVVLTLVMTGGWYHAYRALEETWGELVASTLEPVAALLAGDEALVKELLAEPFTEKDAGILASYLAKIRRDGVAKHADMKQRLDQIAENNTAIVTLIQAYSPHAKTPAFTTEADKFRNYASAWRDRWNSVMELFMAGGNYPATEVRFPQGFPAAVAAELAANK